MTGHIDPAMSEAEYHRRPELSSTQARLLLDSPARYHYAQSHPQPPRDAFDIGSAVHAKVLGVGASVVVLEFPDFRSKAAQTARDEARAAGQTPLLAKSAAEVDAIAESVLANVTARALFEQAGTSETSVFATDPDTGAAVRARFDFLPADPGKGVAVDLKTTAGSASPRGFEKSVANYGYDVQQGHYQHAYKAATGHDVPMVFVVVEKEPPYLSGTYQLNHQWTDMGAVRAAHARDIYARCTSAGDWPGLPTDIQLIQPPFWAISEYQESFND